MERIRSFIGERRGQYIPLSTSPPSQSLDSPYSEQNTHDHLPNPARSSNIDLDQSTVSWQQDAEFSLRSIDYSRLSRQIFLALLPSWIFPSRRKTRKLFPTSYLDGLRGIAAFFVVIYHYSTTYVSVTYTGYGLEKGQPGSHNWFWLLPVFRVVIAGHFMVVIFFVLSGYVLSYRSLKLARQGKYVEVLESLASSVFRRWLRLHLPVVASTFLAFILGRWNAWNYMYKGWEHDPNGSYVFKLPKDLPSRRGGFFTQLGDWYLDAVKMVDPFRFAHVRSATVYSKYNINVLWTIPVEWMGSMLVFAVVLGLCRTKTWVKLSTLTLLIQQCHSNGRWIPACFLTGVLLAEVSFIHSRPIPTNPNSPTTSLPTETEKALSSTQIKHAHYISLASKTTLVLLCILALHMGCHPRDFWNRTPGYQWMYRHLPTAYAKNEAESVAFWPSIGAALLILCLENAPFLQCIFTTSFAQYLGEISFALYMVHTQIIYTLGNWLAPRVMDITGGWANGQVGFVGGMVLMIAVTGPVTFWLADVFSRLVDEKCVKFARWVGVKAFVKL